MISNVIQKSGGFNPLRISGLALWLDASDVSTITLDGSNNVSQWRDKSGNARHVAQAVAASRPTVSRSTLTGLQAIKFENKILTHDLNYILGSFFIVWEHPTTFSGGYNGIGGYRTLTTSSSIEMSVLLPLNPGGPPPTRVWGLYNASQTSTIIRFNRSQVPDAQNEPNNASPARVSPNRWNYMSATFPVNSGRKFLHLGTEAGSPSTRMMQNGHIAEVIGYNKPLSNGEILEIENYFAVKWGIF